MTAWVRSTEFYTNPDNSFFPLAVYFSSYSDPNVYPNIPPNLALDQWVPVDLKPHDVPADAKYAILAGILIITGAANLTIAMRAPGSTSIPTGAYYDEQAVSVLPYGGERSVGFNVVPLVDGVFEINIRADPYPLGGPPISVGNLPSVGCNLKLEGWGR